MKIKYPEILTSNTQNALPNTKNVLPNTKNISWPLDLQYKKCIAEYKQINNIWNLDPQ